MKMPHLPLMLSFSVSYALQKSNYSRFSEKGAEWYKALLQNLNVLIDVKCDMSVNKKINRLVNDAHSATNIYKFLFCSCYI